MYEYMFSLSTLSRTPLSLLRPHPYPLPNRRGKVATGRMPVLPDSVHPPGGVRAVRLRGEEIIRVGSQDIRIGSEVFVVADSELAFGEG